LSCSPVAPGSPLGKKGVAYGQIVEKSFRSYIAPSQSAYANRRVFK